MDLSKMFVSNKVFTPPEKIVNDIKWYLLPEWTDEAIDRLKLCSVLWNKIVRITERLELVDHIDVFRKIIVSTTKYEKKSECRFDCVCTVFGHDYAGAHKDFEALEIYLLMAAVDELMQEEHKDFYEWLNAMFTEGSITSVDQSNIKKLNEEYKNDYGMTVGVRKAFCEYLSKDLRDEWRQSYCALKLQFKDGKVMESVNTDQWENLSEEKQLKYIVDALLNCRNMFTHTATRQFECDVPFENRRHDEDLVPNKMRVMFRKSKKALPINSLLRKSIKSIADAYCQKKVNG